MNTFWETAVFSRPYLGRYWFRFVVGIVLGIAFGFSNGLCLGSIYFVLSRLDDPKPATAVVAPAALPPAATYPASAVAAPAAPGPVPQRPPPPSLKAAPPAAPPLTGWAAFRKQWKAQDKIWKKALADSIDRWLPKKGEPLDWKRMTGGFLIIPLSFAFRGLLGYGSSYLLAWSGQRITNAVKYDAFRKIASLSLDYFQKTTTNELIQRIEADGASLNNFLKLGLSDLVKEPSTIVCMLGTLFYLDWRFTLISLAFVPLCIIPTRKVTQKIRALNKRDFGAAIGQGGVTMESFQNIRITKAYGLEDIHAEKFARMGDVSAYVNVKTVQSKEMLNPVVQTLNAASISILLLYAFWTNTTYSTLVTFIGALLAFYTPFKKMNGLGVYLTQLGLSLERLMALFKLQPSVREADHPLALPDFQRSLDFQHVSFSYGDATVLDDVSFTLRRGERLGLAGESGSGKSSLLNLVFRFYDPTAGRISVDGLPMTELRLSDLRNRLALVSQDVLLFNGTVAENIGFGKLGATRDEIIAAAKGAYAHDFIEELPKGYDTPIGERGQRLSGGQRQRLAIARAFVRNAPLLILDEATASLDSQSEAEVQKAIDNLAENRTVICVAHRLSTLRTMDRILVLQKGRVIEQGGFDELLDRNGPFAEMAARQHIFAPSMR